MTYNNDNLKTSSTCVLVLGSHRSGTSVLSRALITAGVNFGNNFIAPRPDNPKGFFEDLLVNQLNEEFIAEIQCRWNTLILPTDIASQIVCNYHSKIKDKIIQRFSDTQLWGLKDPRLSRLWPFWLPVFKENNIKTTIVMTSRHPFSVVSSLAKRDCMIEQHSLALWALHQLDALNALAQEGGLVVDYDLLMNDPNETLFRLSNYLQTHQNIDQNEITAYCNKFISQELRHTYYQNIQPFSPLQNLCIQLHEEISKFSLLQGGLDAEHCDYARNIVLNYREKLSIFQEWMQAIDSYQSVLSQSLNQIGHAPSESQARLYFSELIDEVPQNYTEFRCAFTHYKISKNRQEIHLSFPHDIGPLARLRLDPSSCQVGFVLHTLKLILPNGNELWSWDNNIHVFKNILGITIQHTTEGSFFLCWDTDPQFEITLAPDILCSLQPNTSLLIELTPYLLQDACKILLYKDDEVHSKYSNIINSTRCIDNNDIYVQLSSVLNKIYTLSHIVKVYVEKRDKKIQNQSLQINDMRSELSHFEAQINLLKEIVLQNLDNSGL